ncbi:MAG: GIY-YIG nuclease family protein [Nitrospirales bacterium]
MKYIYLIRSKSHPQQTYIGITSNLKKRMSVHNNGGSVHTAKSKPWELITSLAFSDTRKAIEFERYLKTRSRRAFVNKRLW